MDSKELVPIRGEGIHGTVGGQKIGPSSLGHVRILRDDVADGFPLHRLGNPVRVGQVLEGVRVGELHQRDHVHVHVLRRGNVSHLDVRHHLRRARGDEHLDLEFQTVHPHEPLVVAQAHPALELVVGSQGGREERGKDRMGTVGVLDPAIQRIARMAF